MLYELVRVRPDACPPFVEATFPILGERPGAITCWDITVACTFLCFCGEYLCLERVFFLWIFQFCRESLTFATFDLSIS